MRARQERTPSCPDRTGSPQAVETRVGACRRVAIFSTSSSGAKRDLEGGRGRLGGPSREEAVRREDQDKIK